MHRIGRGWGLELRRQARHGRELCVALERMRVADGVIFFIFLRFPFRKRARKGRRGEKEDEATENGRSAASASASGTLHPPLALVVGWRKGAGRSYTCGLKRWDPVRFKTF